MSKFEVTGINHMGFVVENVDDTMRVWEALFGVKGEIHENKELKVRYGSLVIGGVKFAFNQSTDPTSRWAKFLNENGEGLEHLALTISDLEEACKTAKTLNLHIRFKEHKPMHGCITNFVEKDDLHATSVELMEPAK